MKHFAATYQDRDQAEFIGVSHPPGGEQAAWRYALTAALEMETKESGPLVVLRLEGER